MYRYVNTRTGAVIETPCPCEGEDWREAETRRATARVVSADDAPEAASPAGTAAGGARKPRERRKAGAGV